MDVRRRGRQVVVGITLWYFVTLSIAALSYGILLLTSPAPRPFPVLVVATVVGVPVSYVILGRYY